MSFATILVCGRQLSLSPNNMQKVVQKTCRIAFKRQYTTSVLNKSFVEVHDMLKQKQISAVNLTQHCLADIKEKNPKLNAFITVTEKEAMEQVHNF